MSTAKILAKVRKLCEELPDVSEKLSHGSPCWFVGRAKTTMRQFAAFGDNHHGDGRVALWLAAPPGSQRDLVEMNPDAYFVPAYVGPAGWVGVRLDRDLPWPEIAAAIERAHACKYKPPRIAKTKR